MLHAPTLTGSPRPGLCTDCGVSRMGDGKDCGKACQFIHPDYDSLESKTHGRQTIPTLGEEHFFGVTQSMLRAKLTPPPKAHSGPASPPPSPPAC